MLIPINLENLYKFKSELYEQCEILNEKTILDESTGEYKLIIELNSRKLGSFSKIIHKIEVTSKKQGNNFSYIEISNNLWLIEFFWIIEKLMN